MLALLSGYVAAGHLVLAGILERQANRSRRLFPWLPLEVADTEDGWILISRRWLNLRERCSGGRGNSLYNPSLMSQITRCPSCATTLQGSGGGPVAHLEGMGALREMQGGIRCLCHCCRWRLESAVA